LNHYEMINIVDVHWEDGDLSQAEKMISGEIVKAGGEVLDIGSMGRRKLSTLSATRAKGFTSSPTSLILPRGSLPCVRTSS